MMSISPFFTDPDPFWRYLKLSSTLLAVTVLMASVTYHFIEYPFDAKKKFK